MTRMIFLLNHGKQQRLRKTFYFSFFISYILYNSPFLYSTDIDILDGEIGFKRNDI